MWTVDRSDRLDADTTTFTAMVQRVGCNNGVTGEVQEPRVEVEDGEVIVTFTVKPDQSTADCLGNDRVAHEVLLPEPLGHRRLVDGQCEPDAEGSGTRFCQPDGVRHTPG